MKNIVTSFFPFSEIPKHIRKYFYLDDVLVHQQVALVDTWEKLVEVKDIPWMLVSLPFWKDEDTFCNGEDPELNEILSLEWSVFKKYLEDHPDFRMVVREKVYEKLVKVATFFSQQGYILAIKMGYRPVKVQECLFEKIFDFFKKKYSYKRENDIYAITLEYIADPSHFVAPHTTGGAVDVILLERDYRPLDFWSPINFPWESSWYTYNTLSLEARKHRDLLADGMLSVWFANLASEWWHFSYGDPYWAYFYWKKETLYTPL